jgi:hypothetical protein
MIPADIPGSGRRRADRAGVAYPDTFAASNALIHNIDRPFAYLPNGFGWTGTYARGMALAQILIEMNEA